MTLLVSAGEASGDAMAAPVVRTLGTSSFGLGGRALSAAGTELSVDLRALTGMGIGGVLRRAPAIVGALRRLLSDARERRPRAALLVGYSEFNAQLGPRLRALGIRVLWYAPPQVWAWRPGRASKLGQAADRMAVVLPFEEALWRQYGVDTHFVGHPALEPETASRERVRERLGFAPRAEYVAVLPGSRPHEVEAHIRPMLDAVAALRADRGALDARVVIAPSLLPRLARRVELHARRMGVGVLEASAPSVLPAFDVALATSGSVTLECTAAGVPPVICYQPGPLTEFFARRLLRVQMVGLPNLVLNARVFPELLSNEFNAELLAEAAGRLLDERGTFVRACADVRNGLCATARPKTSEQVADLVAPWLS